ncbi:MULTISPECIES: 3'-5' exonuclease [Rhizobium]|uniref:3'-5' exonuclease n=1 Tax=Rhizobium phaseoli TaxID=396 RepID=A0A192TJL4_9HYPH|nr:MULTISPECIES: 3'-5' exonuclease [Rhizobium]MDH6648593.1 DNA polymerase-3 subunit epsilon [Rhizobium esperanzae]ANL43396.1 DNA polymerase III subunit epsilon protein [Rhizobium phaseoli]ANL56396.1 DNA polymerase III subunit epsilon protein [Rhizobium phaseoli]ANL62382.1 DNA polymerase III subunit epsilon protein [Rhizobium phaseoli]ANL87796.1 DNA polymerase III subunit epsilon protein [Rhizobium phaseoli]
MSVQRDSQLDMFAKPSPAAAKVRAPSRRPPSQPDARSDEDMARALEESGNYRILRKLTGRPIASVRRPEFSRLGVVLDTETTGLNHRSDEIIEIGAVAFTFDDDGAIGDIVGIYGGLQQPSRPIPREVTRLTGITDAMVEGQVIDIRSLSDLIEPADLIIAHNAGFDRPFCEAFSPLFTGKAWACSVSEIDWSARGFEGTKLGYLVGQAGYFHEGHRAVDDCHALLEILDRQQGEGESPFAELYRASQRSRIRIFAEHSPFEMKDHLKARGYRWSDGSDGRLKSWWIEVGEEDLGDELSYLRAEIYRWREADPPTVRLTAFDRFKP